MKKLAILIPALESRNEYFSKLYRSIITQMPSDNSCIVIQDGDNGQKAIGKKRNDLIQKAVGVEAQYIAFIDDDDAISDNYIQHLMEGIEKDVDCCSLKGIITYDGINPEIFEHSIKYSEWKTTDNVIKHERFPNHLNCIKLEIAKQFKFPEKNFGEDFDWSTQIHNSGLIKTEHYVEDVIYFYQYKNKINN